MDQLREIMQQKQNPTMIRLNVSVVCDISEEILVVTIDENVSLNIFVESCIIQSQMFQNSEIQLNEVIVDIIIGMKSYKVTDRLNLLEIGAENDSCIRIKIQKNKNIKSQQMIFDMLNTEEQLINNYQNILFSNLDKQEQQYQIQQERYILREHFFNPHKNMKSQNDLTFLQKKLHLINNAFKLNLKQNQLNNNIITIDKNNQDLFDNRQFNIDLLMFVLANQYEKSGQKLYQTKKNDQINILSLQASFAFGLQNYQCLELTIKNNEDINYQSLQDETKLNIFQKSIKYDLARQFKISPDDIKLLQIVEGSIKVFVYITNEAGVEVKIQWNQNINQLYRIHHQSKLVLHKYFQEIQLSTEDFAPEYNFEWEINHQQFQLRGPQNDKIKYFFPRGWKGYALRVKGKYDEGNDDWLAMDNNPNQWHIMYHGTKQYIHTDGKKQSCVKGILEQGFMPGKRQQYQEDVDIRLREKIGQGVYFSNHIEVAEIYADPMQIGEYNYKVVFQSRVRPESLKQIKKKSEIRDKLGNPDWDNDYFVVNRPEDIRPYRILLKKSRHNQQDKSGGFCEIF